MSYSENSMRAEVPSQEAIEAGLANFKPRPSEGFYRRMALSPWMKASPSTRGNRMSSNSFKWAVAALVGLLLSLGLAATPWGQTFANEVFKLFVHAESDTRPLSAEEMSAATPPPGATRVPNAYTKLSVSELETQLGFDIKEPTVLPDQFYLDGIFVFYEKNQVNFIYEFSGGGRGLIILQKPVSDATPAEVGPEATITEVQIGGVKGEYVEGSYSYRPGDTVATWHSDGPMRGLLWVQDEILFGIEIGGGSPGHPGYVGLTEMIAIAEGLK